MQSIINPFGYTQVQSAALGVVINVSSVVGCLLLGYVVEKTKKFKLGIVLSSIIGLAVYGLFTGALFWNNFVVLAIIVGVLAFVLSPSGPVALEFGCEITFPVGEALAGGAILSVIQLVCPAQTFIVGAIMENKDQKKGAIYSIIMLIAFMAAGFVCSLFIKQNLVRSTHDKHADDKAAADRAAAESALRAQNNPETPMPLINHLVECGPTPIRA